MSQDMVTEGVLDALVTTLGSQHDIRRFGRLRTSLNGAMYVAKPKPRGLDEGAFTVELS